MARKRRDIPWDTLKGDAGDAEARAKVAETWEGRARQEHLAVGAFALITTELVAEGCDPTVLGIVTRAASDEVRHAELCMHLACALRDTSPRRPRVRGMPDVPKHPEATPSERALLHMVEMCCLSETFTGVYLTEMRSRAENPAVRAVLESLLRDEIDHGRAGWAYLASVGAIRSGATLASALPDMIERAIGWVITRAAEWPEPDDPALEALGYLGNDAGAALAAHTLEQVVLPGLEQLDVDLAPARARIAERNWLASSSA